MLSPMFFTSCCDLEVFLLNINYKLKTSQMCIKLCLQDLHIEGYHVSIRFSSLIKFIWVKLDIMAHARVFQFKFFLARNPFKSCHEYGMIGKFGIKLHGIISQDLLFQLSPLEQ